MLLKSASVPILESCCDWGIHQSSPELDVVFRIPATRPISVSVLSNSASPIDNNSTMNKNRTKRDRGFIPKVKKNFSEGVSSGTALLGSTVGLDEGCHVGGGGGGGGGAGSGDGSGGNWDGGNERGSMDEYYQKMTSAYPGDALLLGNYARFLKEVNASCHHPLRKYGHENHLNSLF